MDPDATLAALHAAIAEYEQETDTAARCAHSPNRERVHQERADDAARDATDHAADLIEWIDKGGHLPSAWQPFAAASIAGTEALRRPGIADLAERAARIADDAAQHYHDTRDGIAAAAHHHIRWHDHDPAEQLAAALAVGMSHYGTDGPDLATRTATHLRTLADQIAPR